VKPIWERTKEGDAHMGWVFPVSDAEEPDAEPDALNGAKSIRELYELASANYSGKYTVPVCVIQLLRHACYCLRYLFDLSDLWLVMLL